MRQSFQVERLESRSLLSGGLDPTFGTNGIVSGGVNYLPGGSAQAIVVQADGRIVIAANYVLPTASPDPTGPTGAAVLRLLANGALDPSFGDDGVVKLGTNELDALGGIALQQGGKIVAVGREADVVVTAQLNPDGSLDASFGNAGFATTTFGGAIPDSGELPGIAVQKDGRIVVACTTSDNAIAVARYAATGTLDSSFGTDGEVIPTQSIGHGQATMVVEIGQNGQITIDGSDVMRLTSDGELDTSFGQSGIAVSDVSEGIAAEAIEPDGKLVLGGDVYQASTESYSFGAERLTDNGGPDSSFGTRGLAKAVFRDRSLPASALADADLAAVSVDQRGRTVLVGSVGNQFMEGGSDFALARLTPSGQLDDSFGVRGLVSTGGGNIWPGNADRADAMAIEPNGDILVAGASNGGSSWSLAGGLVIARFTQSGQLDKSFGYEGRAGILPNVPAVGVTALQSDGKMIVAASYSIARLNADGSLDPTFGDKGMIVRKTDAADDNRERIEGRQILFVLPMTGGETLIGTEISYDRSHGPANSFSYIRYTNAGKVDATFTVSNATLARIAKAAPGFVPQSAAVQNDGRILLWGSDTDSALVVVRLTAHGALDASYGNRGAAIPNLQNSPASVYVNAIFVNSDNSATAVVSTETTGADGVTPIYSDTAIHLTAAGNLDSSFGLEPISVEGSDYISQAVQFDDGAIESIIIHPIGVSIARWVNGKLDDTFGSDGLLNLPLPSDFAALSAAIVNNVILVGGSESNSGKVDTVVAFNLDGSLDTSFGNQGFFSLPQPLYAYQAFAVPNTNRALFVDAAEPPTLDAITLD